ncbi:hypothetical protein [Brachybacterium aquaticum]|uniref:Uncharacterized protein n=1 Tax=Brachybacterium aquaticum TaxID=1432564 RepID=A0A841ABB2_9MICO|nr:hypothetical protein [Brachybacterium aquaticum]MBB5831237.1 hypothetical protein [Brachybacterium aquaticum]
MAEGARSPEEPPSEPAEGPAHFVPPPAEPVSGPEARRNLILAVLLNGFGCVLVLLGLVIAVISSR